VIIYFFIKNFKIFSQGNKMEILGNAFMPKLCPKFYCQNCDYGTSKKSSYDNHLMSLKHAKSLNGNKMEIFGNAFMPKLCSNNFTCQKCNKEFKTSPGLWKHNKKCPNKNQDDLKNDIKEIAKNIKDKDELIMFLIKENSEFKSIIMEQQNMMMKVLENGTNNVTNTNTNCMNNNKTFNLQFFLNETCKDAMNIMDFVDSIKLQLSDLEKFGDLSYVDGISNIITSNLKALDVTQRPVHCTDKKRETMYIKDENQWEKADENKSKLRKAIKRIADKNIRLLPQFREKYPEYKNSSSKVSDKYDKMVIEAMGGLGNNDLEKEDKIIHNISKCVVIDK
jgi:hypothetical protein